MYSSVSHVLVDLGLGGVLAFDVTLKMSGYCVGEWLPQIVMLA